jgi:hypothetical protein
MFKGLAETALCSVFLLLAACSEPQVPSPPKPAIVGGMTAANTGDADVVKAATFAASRLGSGLDSVLDASRQVVAGMNYAMTLKLKNGAVYKVLVYHDLQDHYSLTESSKQ